MKQFEYFEKLEYEEYTNMEYRHIWGKFDNHKYDLYQISAYKWNVRIDGIECLSEVSKKEITKDFPFMRKAMREIKSWDEIRKDKKFGEEY